MAAAQDKKGHNLTVIDLQGAEAYADYLVIVSATSERQTSALAESIIESLRDQHQVRPLDREGRGGWVLIDYGDVVVHVFIEDARAFYDIDRLWSQAPRLTLPIPTGERASNDGPALAEVHPLPRAATARRGSR